MAPKTDTIENIPNSKPVRAFLPILGTVERYRVSCMLEKATVTEFDLLFRKGELPADSIDSNKTCLIIVDVGGSTVSIEARVLNVPNDQTLRLRVEKSISHEQLREFFRVDATTEVISSSFIPEFFDSEGNRWRLKGKTIDISGSGILATFKEKPPTDNQVRLEFTLPTGDKEVISVLAHPVRCQQLDTNNYEVAYHFDDVSAEDRDRIIGCCLIIQRRHLRLKVQVDDSVQE